MTKGVSFRTHQINQSRRTKTNTEREPTARANETTANAEKPKPKATQKTEPKPIPIPGPCKHSLVLIRGPPAARGFAQSSIARKLAKKRDIAITSSGLNIRDLARTSKKRH